MRKPAAKPTATRQKRPFYLNPKILFLIAGASLVIAALAAAAPYLVPSRTCLGWLEKNIGEKLGARVAVKDIRLKSFPYLGFSIDGLDVVSDKPPFQGLSIIRAERVSGSLSLGALMDGKIVTSIDADGLTADFRISAGRTNIADTLGMGDGAETSAAEGLEVPTPGMPATLAAPLPAAEGRQEDAGFKVLPAGPAAPEVPAAPNTTPAPEKAPAEPSPEKSPDRPQSLRSLDEIFIRSAMAEDEAADDTAVSNLEIKSLNVTDGSINIRKDNVLTAAIENVSLAAKRLVYPGGIGANFSLNGAIVYPGQGAAGTSVSARGQAFFDERTQGFLTKGLAINIADSHITLDSSFEFSKRPAKFSIKIAAPDLSRNACGAFFQFLPEWLSKNLSWQGDVSLDLSVRGADEFLEVNAGIDAARAGFSFGKFLTKAAGFPSKAVLSLISDQRALVLNSGSVTIGESSFKVAGEFARDERSTIDLDVRGEGLNDSSLKAYFPWISFADSIAGLNVSADIEGELLSDNPLKIAGSFGAKDLGVAGIALTDAEGTYEYTSVPGSAAAEDAPGTPPKVSTKHVISFPTFKAAALGGALSGNGIFSLGDTADLNFDAVCDRVDASNIGLLGGAISGNTSLVIKAASSGADASAFAKDLKLTGTLVLASGAWSKVKPISGLFSLETWGAIENITGAKLSEAGQNKLAAVDANISDLSASFEMSPGFLKFGRVEWKNPQYEAAVSGEIDAESGVMAAGEVTVTKEGASLLVPAASQKLILTSKGLLVLPVKLSGKPTELTASLDRAKFEEAIKTLKPATVQKQAVETATQKAPAAAKKEGAPPQRQGRPAESKPKKKPVITAPKQNEEDILKVIIGK